MSSAPSEWSPGASLEQVASSAGANNKWPPQQLIGRPHIDRLRNLNKIAQFGHFVDWEQYIKSQLSSLPPACPRGSSRSRRRLPAWSDATDLGRPGLGSDSIVVISGAPSAAAPQPAQTTSTFNSLSKLASLWTEGEGERARERER